MDLRVTPVFAKYNSIFQEKIYRQIVLYGGSRSSKTYGLMQSMVIEMIKRERLRITVWRNEKVTCRGTVMNDFRDIIYKDIYLNKIFVENKALGMFTCTLTGSVILFEGADSISKVLGLHQHISIFNEITEFSEAVYLQITQRTEETIFADYNPSKKFWFDRMKLREDTIFIHSDFRDNPFLAENIVKQLLSYEPWETGTYEVIKGVPMYRGKKITKENQPPPHKKNTAEKTANVYMWLVYGLGIGAEKPNKIHYGWEPISDEAFDKLPYKSYYGLDFGTAKPTACVEVKYDGDRTFFIKQRMYTPMNVEPKPLHELILNIAGKDGLVVCDSAKMSYVTSLKQNGVLAVPARKGPDSVNLGLELIQMFNIYVTKGSLDIWDEYETYSWELDRYNKPTDKPVKKDDHSLDAIRYIIHYLYFYLGIKLNHRKGA